MTTPCDATITLEELKDPDDFFQKKVFSFLNDEQKGTLNQFTSKTIKVSHDGNGNITFSDGSFAFSINIEQIVKNEGCNSVATSFFNTLFTGCPKSTDKINIQCGIISTTNKPAEIARRRVGGGGKTRKTKKSKKQPKKGRKTRAKNQKK